MTTFSYLALLPFGAPPEHRGLCCCHSAFHTSHLTVACDERQVKNVDKCGDRCRTHQGAILILMEAATNEKNIVEASTPEGAVQEMQEPQAHGGSLKRRSYPVYKNFDGQYRKLQELRHRIPEFRDFYIQKRFVGKEKLSAIKIVDQFNELYPHKEGELPFFPNPGMYQRWRKRWDAEQTGLVKTAEVRLAEREEARLINTDDPHPMEILEERVNTLGAELANDAMQTLRETQDREEYFDDEVVVKRKQYALNVFAYITKAAHSKATLDLKRHAEGRETAGFMLDILRRANAGKLSSDEIAVLRGSIRPKQEYGDPVGAGAA